MNKLLLVFLMVFGMTQVTFSSDFVSYISTEQVFQVLYEQEQHASANYIVNKTYIDKERNKISTESLWVVQEGSKQFIQDKGTGDTEISNETSRKKHYPKLRKTVEKEIQKSVWPQLIDAVQKKQCKSLLFLKTNMRSYFKVYLIRLQLSFYFMRSHFV